MVRSPITGYRYRQVGLTATTLVAIRVKPGEKIKEITRLINAYPEVSHNCPAGTMPFRSGLRSRERTKNQIQEIIGEIGRQPGSAKRISSNSPRSAGSRSTSGSCFPAFLRRRRAMDTLDRDLLADWNRVPGHPRTVCRDQGHFQHSGIRGA